MENNKQGKKVITLTARGSHHHIGVTMIGLSAAIALSKAGITTKFISDEASRHILMEQVDHISKGEFTPAMLAEKGVEVVIDDRRNTGGDEVALTFTGWVPDKKDIAADMLKLAPWAFKNASESVRNADERVPEILDPRLFRNIPDSEYEAAEYLARQAEQKVEMIEKTIAALSNPAKITAEEQKALTSFWIFEKLEEQARQAIKSQQS